jgi:tetratricopeptide (TPR) repeat protein
MGDRLNINSSKSAGLDQEFPVIESQSKSASPEDDVNYLKEEGNKAFAAKDFTAADSYYTLAINRSKANAALYTNRAACHLERNSFDLALNDANEALKIDSTWTKAYFRKYSALKKLNRSTKELFDVISTAWDKCERTDWLKNEYPVAAKAWLTVSKMTEIADPDDFLNRFKLILESREKLSTMVHL